MSLLPFMYTITVLLLKKDSKFFSRLLFVNLYEYIGYFVEC